MNKTKPSLHSKEVYQKKLWFKNLTDEQKVVFETRIGMMVEDGDPSTEQMKIAWKEAVGAI